MDQDIYIKREQFDLSDPLEIQENEGITSEINDQVHGRYNPYSCPLCDKSFSKSGNLQRHIESIHEGKKIFLDHEREKPNTCSHCSAAFYKKSDLRNHIDRVHEKKKPHKCFSCDYSAASKGDVNKHFRKYHENIKQDGNVFSENNSLSKSVKRSPIWDYFKVIEGDKSKARCNICEKDYKYDTSNNLTKHLKSQHKSDFSKFLEVSAKFQENYHVFSGPARFANDPTLEKQEVSVHEKFSSKLCEETDSFTEKSVKIEIKEEEYGQNRATVHDVKEGFETNCVEDLFKCDFCDAKYETKPGLYGHVLAVHERRFECDSCKKSFPSNAKLKEHFQTVHEGKKPFSCSLCESRFVNKQGLKNHILAVHERKKPHQCSICERSFALKKHLDKHSATVHERDTLAHKCSQCDAAFYDKCGLKDHVNLVHERIKPDEENKLLSDNEKKKPNKCSLCDASFREKSDLKQHVNRVHEKKKTHKCSFCYYSAASKGDLMKHIRRIHEKLKPEICYQELTDEVHMKTHVNEINDRTVHDDKKSLEVNNCDEGILETLESANFPIVEIKVEETIYVEEENEWNNTNSNYSNQNGNTISFEENENPSLSNSTKGPLIWNYFKVVEGDKGKAMCNICKKYYKYRTLNNTLDLRRHLKSKHKSDFLKFEDCEDVTNAVKSVEVNNCDERILETLESANFSVVEIKVEEAIDVEEENEWNNTNSNDSYQNGNNISSEENENPSLLNSTKGPLIWNYFKVVEGDEGKARCNICNKDYKYRTLNNTLDLRRHLKSKHKSNFSKFEDCKDVNNPVKMEASELGETSEQKDRQKTLFPCIITDSETGLETCTFCEKVFQGPHQSVRLRNAMEHIDSVHLKARSHKCKFCDKKYPRKSQLCTHLKLKHSEEIVSKQFLEGSESSLSLDAKFKKNPERHHAEFDNKEELNDHIKIHMGESELKCSVCNINFSQRRAFHDHFNSIHDGKRLSKCHICDRILSSNFSLQDHISSVHEGKKPHLCMICGNSFSFKQTLERHIASVHEGHKRFICEECGKSFTVNENLQKHIQSVHQEKEECAKCDYSPEYSFSLKKHIVLVHEQKNLECDICKVSYPFEQSFNEHIESIHKRCSICYKEFSDKGRLKRHIEWVHEKIKPFLCKICEASFTNMQTLQNHILAVHEKKKPHKCSFCDFRGAFKKHLVRHIKEIHERKKTIACLLCDEMFVRKYQLKTHMKSVHNSKEEKETSEINSVASENVTFIKEELVKNLPISNKFTRVENEINTFEDIDMVNEKCSFVPLKDYKNSLNNQEGSDFDDKSDFEDSDKNNFEHFDTIGKNEECNNDLIVQIKEDKDPLYDCDISENQENGMKTFENLVPAKNLKSESLCSLCGKKYAKNWKLKRHIATVHEGVKPFECDICHTKFALKEGLKQHNARFHDPSGIHIKEIESLCSLCGKKYAQNWKLKRHIATVHEGVKPFECDICHTKFALKEGLKQHNARFHDPSGIQIKEIESLCSHCGKKYSQSWKLKRHIAMVHERNTLAHKCSICDGTFYDRSGLKEHIKRVHEKERPHSCSLCDYSASMKGDLKKHIKKVHDKIRTENCSICYKVFTDKSNLKTHVDSVHERKKPFLCTICDTGFGSNQGLKKHIFRKHREIETTNQ